MLKKILFLLFLLFFYSTNIVAGDYEEGVDAFVKGNYEVAIEKLKKAAKDGHVEAQAGLANMYFYGQGTEININEAIHWYTEAANNNHAASQYQLGELYRRGIGNVAKDIETAVKWYTKAAEQDDVLAQYNLGSLYEIVEEYEQALYWWRRIIKLEVDNPQKLAADQWTPVERKRAVFYMAAHNIATMYAKGHGVSQDHKEALYWNFKGATIGAAKFKAPGNDGLPMYSIAYAYREGEGIEKNIVEACKWFYLAHAVSVDDNKKFSDSMRKQLDELAPKLSSQEKIEAETVVVDWINYPEKYLKHIEIMLEQLSK